MSELFAPTKMGTLEVKNKIVLPPMVCFTFAGDNGHVSEKNIQHYRAIAKGGTGLIIIEATCIHENGRLAKDQLAIWSDEFIDGLGAIARACHEYGAKVLIQLHHAGLRTAKSIHEDTVTSSDYHSETVSARAMTWDEIQKIKEDFIHAAVRAKKAGFDGVELHGAHSYLMTQFFSTKVNKRTDEYGGNLENRMRLAIEILNGIRNEIHAPFIVGIRMGCNEDGLTNSIEMARRFEAAGMDFLHVSTGFDNTPIEESVPEGFVGNWIVYGATKLREHVKIPVIAVNSIKTREEAEFLIERHLVDFVAMGRAQLADYNFVNHIRNQKDIIKCLGCKPCRWFSNGENCTARVRLIS
jgi:2,4-dienoyl-CoA reductase-like NADH-dependent reductase (Old Yellow Enzyme family)